MTRMSNAEQALTSSILANVFDKIEIRTAS